MRGLQKHLTYANVVSSIAMFAALGGVSYAAVKLPKNSVTSAAIRPGAVKSPHLAKNAVISAKVKDGSLLARDFKAGQLPSGQKGDPGAQGPKGDKGDPGPAGVAGSARAYAHVTRDGEGGFILDGARSKNVVNVVLPGTGNDDRPCLVLPASIDASSAVAIGTVDAQNTPSSATAEIQHRVGGEFSQACSGNSIALYLKRNGPGTTDTIAFNVMVP